MTRQKSYWDILKAGFKAGWEERKQEELVERERSTRKRLDSGVIEAVLINDNNQGSQS